MGNKREKNPTFTYIKEFDTFSEGYKELITLIPQLAMYGGDNPDYSRVVYYMTSLINENLPSPLNEQYPNTLSLSISAKEVGFLTDDSLAFGWKIFVNRKDGSMTFQFRVTFISLSMSKRKYIETLVSNKWKARDLVEKQSRFWHEATSSQRATIKDVSTNTRRTDNQSTRLSNGDGILDEKRGDIVPRHSNSSINRQSSPEKTNRVLAETPKTEDREQEPIIAKPVVVEQNEISSQKPVVTEAKYSNPPQAKTKYAKVSNPTQTVKMSSGETEKNIELNRLRVKESCSIVEGDTPAQFIITHKGQTRRININDNKGDFLLNRACDTLMIENVVYNYKNFQVTVLDEEYKPESATELGCSNGSGLVLPDTAFVGDKAKRKFLEDHGLSSGNEIVIPGKEHKIRNKPFVVNKPNPTKSAKPVQQSQMIKIDNVGGPNL